MDDCGYFDRHGIKTMTEKEWRGMHDTHGPTYAIAQLEHAPKDYPAYWLICNCGARILTMVKKPEGIL